uniref:Spt4/RpoE2 zinc finger domain-containing protein n=1 Tax=Oncorhynchus tshawytscha TaxID=74940 RepID=A0A8C8G8V8_ONCTS
MKGNREMVYECTSSSFDDPEDSWVAKWQRISNFKPGVYAVTVTGRLPPGIFTALQPTRGVERSSRRVAISGLCAAARPWKLIS